MNTNQNLNQNTVEGLQQFSRRSMIGLLFVVATLGGTALALILSPEAAVGRSANRVMWLIPVVIVVVVAAIQSSLRGRQWKPDSPEVRTVLNDEWRRLNLDRSARIALVVTVAAQLPLAVLFGFAVDLLAVRATMAMAAASITLGLLTLLTLFLYFDRE
jgi:4-amino-4-deoxy-L-arabinose transferase-like glycosyltransferase